MYRVNEHEFKTFEQMAEWARIIHGIDFGTDGEDVSEVSKQEICRIMAEFTNAVKSKT